MIRKLDETVMVSGQIQPADVAGLKDQGVSMIVCNRPDEEEPGQPSAAKIERAAKQSEIQFRHIPISRGIDPSDAQGMKEAIEAADGKLLAYCRTGNRSALVWAVARRGQGASVEELEKAAAQAGVDLAPVAHLL
ncbi:MAG TPA: TIGR01244 family sulfur transferase [Sphingomicrobium sp.]|nr:TIGR01244 family sulfur transferase [Sphingomicrobium sp.]